MRKLLIIILLILCTACQATPDASPTESLATKTSPISTSTSSPEHTVTKTDNSFILNEIPVGLKLSKYEDGTDVIVRGDLNKDSIEDLAFVAEDPTDTLKMRDIAIYFGAKDGSYAQSIYAKETVMCKDCGGVLGDPLDGLEVSNGSVLLSFWGGSGERWYSKYRFQYRDKDWQLVGATEGTYSVSAKTAKETDTNLITGDYIVKTGKARETLKEHTKGKKTPRKLVKLLKFTGSMYDDNLSILETDNHVSNVRVSPDGNFAYYVYSSKDADSILEESFVENLQDVKPNPKPVSGVGDEYIGDIFWSPDSKYLFIDMGTSPQRGGNLYDVKSMKLLKSIYYEGGVFFSPDSSKLAYSNGKLNDIVSIASDLLDGYTSADLVILDITTLEEYALLKATETTRYSVTSWKTDNGIGYSKVTYSMLNGKLKYPSVDGLTTSVSKPKPSLESTKVNLYKNKTLHFSLEFPKSWENKYTESENRDGVTFSQVTNITTKGVFFSISIFGTEKEWNDATASTEYMPYRYLGIRDGLVYVETAPDGEQYNTTVPGLTRISDDYFALLEKKDQILHSFKFLN
jgi:hypothetical protein